MGNYKVKDYLDIWKENYGTAKGSGDLDFIIKSDDEKLYEGHILDCPSCFYDCSVLESERLIASSDKSRSNGAIYLYINVENRNEQIVTDTMKLKNVDLKTVEGIVFILNNLYREMLNEGSKYDLLRLGAVKMSADVFEKISKRMSNNITLEEFLQDI